LKGDDKRPLSRKTFVAKDHAEFLKEIPALVGPGEMQAAMGATKSAFASLTQDGVLVPRIHAPKIIARWRITDGLALVDELKEFTVPLQTDMNLWKSIQQAKKRRGVAVGTIIKLVRDGAMKIAWADRTVGYRGFVVLRAEVDAVSSRQAKIKSKAPEMSGSISAAAFGRSVGLREGGLFLALVNAGHVSAFSITNPNTNTPQYRMTDKNISEFHRKFLTLTTIEAEFGIHRNRIVSMLRTHGAIPFSADGKDFGSIWSRDAVGKIFVVGT